jgi:regulatory protein
LPGSRSRPREPLDPRRARLVAADLLSRHPWTERQLAARLRRRGAPAEVAAAVVSDLTARGHLDDAAFARHWVEARRGRGYGPRRLRAELRARGVAPALIDAALAVTPAAADLEQARAAARRRLPALGRVAPERAATRLRDYLLRRGYSMSVTARVVREVLGAAPSDQA